VNARLMDNAGRFRCKNPDFWSEGACLEKHHNKCLSDTSVSPGCLPRIKSCLCLKNIKCYWPF